MTTIPYSIAEAANALRAGEMSSAELTEACIRRAAQLDGALGAYLARFEDTALVAAEAADAAFEAGVDAGPLQGVPIAVKDLIATAERPTTAQSLILDPAWGAGRDAPVIRRLRRAGAVVMGKTTTMEFAAGFPDPAKPFPLPRNPWDLTTWPGGSSSGSASGLAAGMFLGALGTDTGGSIRMPAAFCGVSGLMPTFGRVPKSGCVPLAFTLDRVGPLARTAWDCAAMLEVMAGHHTSDSSSSTVAVPSLCAGLEDRADLDGLRIGVLSEHHFGEGSEPMAQTCLDGARVVFAELGAIVTEVSIPLYEEVVAATMLSSICEAFAYHRDDLHARWEDYFPSTREMFSLASFVSGADYVQAQRVRRVGQQALAATFKDVDVIATPTATMTAPTYEAFEALGVFAAFALVHTAYWNGVGNPALTVPMGFSARGLPLGMQLAGRPFEESMILQAGHAFQCVTDFHRQLPPLVQAGPERHGALAHEREPR